MHQEKDSRKDSSQANVFLILYILGTLSVWIFCRLRCLLVVMSTYWSSQISLPSMLRLSQPGTNRRNPQPESYLLIVSVIMASLPVSTVARVKVKLLVHTLISRGLSNSYTMGCPPVRGDNPRALASGLSYVKVDNPWYNYFIPPTSVWTLHITYFMLKLVKVV